jgi:Protein of unknown function (DUF3179)
MHGEGANPTGVAPSRGAIMHAAQALFLMALAIAGSSANAEQSRWAREWPMTDFERALVDLGEIRDGGPPKDGIPAIDDPRFRPVAEVDDLADTEPVIGLTVSGESRAYPLRVLTWHEIANDVIGGVPVAVTYCPLCNAAIVFDRRLDGAVLDFGTTGKLRHSDLVMYDRQTESWWQQYSGEAIVGRHAGRTLEMLPARLESWAEFRARVPDAMVLVPEDPGARPYGTNPYVGYDSAAMPFLYDGEVPAGIAPLARVVVVGEEAWSLDRLREAGRIEAGELVLSWRPGQASALDAPRIADGRDVGSVILQRRHDGRLEDVVHHITFAFVFHAFEPNGTLHR